MTATSSSPTRSITGSVGSRPDGTITTIAGNGIPSFLGDGGPATEANLQYPTGVALDHDGNLFIADAANHRIRRIDQDGTITTVAGTGAAGFAGDGGPATEARLHKPTGVAVSRRGELFIADEYNHRIRRVGPHGRISTVAGATELPTNYDGFWPGSYAGDGGPATEAFLNFPTEVLLDGKQHLLIADSSNGRVRSVDHDGIITTIAGGGSDRRPTACPPHPCPWRAAPPAWRSTAPGTSSSARNAAIGCGG